jgi:site-specific DNA-methyltransferase (adenine-specific)
MPELYNHNALDLLPRLVDRGVDLVLTDPPYGTGGWRRKASGQGGNPSGGLVQEDWDDGALGWLALLPPTVRAVGTFWPAAHTRALLVEADRLGLTKHRTLYLRKPDPKPLPGGRTRWSVEPIWVLSRDTEATGHPYQKPLKVMRWLLAKFPWATVVCDPFMGSGTTGVAVLEAGLAFIGCEADPRWYAVAETRLAATLAQSRLPGL